MICRSPPLPSLANMSSIDAQKQKLQTALQAFNAIIKALPKTLSAGDKNGPIATNFTSHKFDSDEGPYYSFDKAWNRTFQVPDTQKIALIYRGKFGLQLVQAYLVHYAQLLRLEEDNGLYLVAERVEALNIFICKQYIPNHLEYHLIC